jgi:apolipoprotein N-acyltransferase
MTRLSRILVGALLSVFGGALLYLSMPPFGLWPLALVGLVPVLFAQYRILPRRIANIAPAIGIGGFIGLVILSVFPDELVERFGYLKLFPLVVIAIVFLAESGTRRFHERTSYRWFVLEGALTWVGIELIRGLIIGTGGFIAYAFYRTPVLLQPMSIFGIYGLSLLAMLIAYALALLTIARYDRARSNHPADIAPVDDRLAGRWAIAMLALGIVWTALGMALFQVPEASKVRVAAVQPRVSTLPNLIDGAREAAAQGAQMIVWPEGALNFDPRVSRTSELKRLAIETNTYLVIGHAQLTPQGLRNEVSILSPQGEFLGVYGKAHPVTYLGETSLTHSGYPTYPTSLGVLGAIICYDLEFTDTARGAARNGAQLIAAPSNDWQSLNDKQYLMPVYRAIENRVAMVKADTQYDSVIVDAYGRILSLAASSQGADALVIGDVALGAADAPQIVLGDWIGWISLIGMLAFMLYEPIEKLALRARVQSRITRPTV